METYTLVSRYAYATHTLVDVEMGWVVHFESYKTAVEYRKMVGRGVIIKVFTPVWARTIRQARAVYGKH